MVIPASSAPVLVADLTTLASLQAAVGGYIESIPLPGYTCYVNEDGQRLSLPVNERFLLLQMTFSPVSQPIVGPVVITGLCDDDGETVDLRGADLAFLFSRLGSPPFALPEEPIP
jgi:hypothetical protein